MRTSEKVMTNTDQQKTRHVAESWPTKCDGESHRRWTSKSGAVKDMFEVPHRLMSSRRITEQRVFEADACIWQHKRCLSLLHRHRCEDWCHGDFERKLSARSRMLHPVPTKLLVSWLEQLSGRCWHVRAHEVSITTHCDQRRRGALFDVL